MSSINYKKLEVFCTDPKEEIENIRKSFQEHISLSDGSTYRPKVMFYDVFGNKKFALSSRKYSDVEDLYKTVAEMLYSYSAFSAGSCILVLDTSVSSNEGALVLYVASDDAAYSYTMSYNYSKDSSFVWNYNKDIFTKLTMDDIKSYSKIVESLFVFTHVEDPPFTASELLSFYSLKGYNFRSFKDIKINYVDYSSVNNS